MIRLSAPPLLLALLLAACSPEPAAKPVAPVKTAAKPADPDVLPVYRVAVAKDGLLLTDPRGGAAKPAAFGLRQSLLIAILARSFGPAAEGSEPRCDRDFARWPNGLTLWFERGDFVGWDLADESAGIALAPGLERRDTMTGGVTCG